MSTMPREGLPTLFIPMLILTILGAVAAPGFAATVVVNTTVDQATGSCTSTCSLRDAVATAHSGDTIQVPAGHFVLTLGVIGSFEKKLTILGAGARATVIDGNSRDRIFNLGSSESIEIDDVALVNGASPDIGGPGCINGNAPLLTLRRCSVSHCVASFGAGLVWSGSVMIDQCTFQDNRATGSPGSPGSLAALYQSVGPATILNSTFSGNVSEGSNLRIESGTLTHVTITANRGGGLEVGLPITLTNSIVAGNPGGDCFLFFPGFSTVAGTASLDGDNTCGLTGPSNFPGVDPLLGPLADHGGPTDTQAPLFGSPVVDHADTAACAAVDQRGVPRPQGAGCDIGAYEQAGAPPPPPATVVVNTTVDQATGSCAGICSLRDAVATAHPGDTIQVPAGHFVLTLGQIASDKNLTIQGAGARKTVIDGNSQDRIFDFSSAGRLEIDDLTLAHGVAPDDHGGGCLHGFGLLLTLKRCAVSNCVASIGGGLAWSGPVTIDQCTFQGNRAQGPPEAPGQFAAIFQAGGTATLVNSTLSGNLSDLAGSITIGSGTLTNVTITANHGGLRTAVGPITLTNTILANNQDGDCGSLHPFLPLTSDHSLTGDGSCDLHGPGDLSGIDPLLAPLADNGGPTDTQAPLAGSPVIDAGNDAACPTADQRGVPRPQGAACDIGAYEKAILTLTADHASVTVNEGQTAINGGTVSEGGIVTLTASVGTVVNHGDGTWSWCFPTTDGPSQSQTVTLTGDDGHSVRSTSFNLVVGNLAPTITSVSNNGPIVAGHAVTLTVTAADPAGANDPLTYAFDCNDDGVFEIGPQAGNSAACMFASAGSFTVPVRVADDDGGVTLGTSVVRVNLPPPDCSHATASPNLLWPPNHKLVAIRVLGVIDPTGGAVTSTITSIFQDEPASGGADGTGVGTSTASVRAERDGNGDGRVYHISFTASALGGTCTGAVTVGVPKSQGQNGGPVDSGSLYDSTLP
ncbi:MAG TPA: choice-of-anchor Q domain-containing protein [Thermoanaerobaculia bacterium]|nr:choice-of-anchor Q domain-containing protein [Thermoanaerobaculia bacterium]